MGYKDRKWEKNDDNKMLDDKKVKDMDVKYKKNKDKIMMR